MNRLVYSDVAAILAMRDSGARSEISDEQLVTEVAALLPKLPKRNGSSVSITRDALSLSYCLLFCESEEVRNLCRSALLYLNRVDDYWPDASPDGNGTLDDQLVLAIAVQEIRRSFGLSSGYSGPLLDPGMAERIEQRVDQLGESALQESFLLGGARSRVMELELSNTGRLAQRLKLLIGDVMSVLKDLSTDERSRSVARGALAYLLEKDDEIPDHLGALGLIDDNYAMLYALGRCGSDAAAMSNALDWVVARWPWLLNLVLDDGQFTDSPPDWMLMTISALQSLGVMGGSESEVGLVVPKAGTLPALYGFFGALALIERAESDMSEGSAPAPGSAVRAIDRVLWTRTPSRPDGSNGRVVVICSPSRALEALKGISILGESMDAAIPIGVLRADGRMERPVEAWQAAEPCLVLADSAAAALPALAHEGIRDCVIVDASYCRDLGFESLAALRERADVLVVCEHRDAEGMALVASAGFRMYQAGRRELAQLSARAKAGETKAAPLVDLERRTAAYLRKRIVPQEVLCPEAAALAGALSRLFLSSGRSEQPKEACDLLLPDVFALSLGMLRFPGLMPRDHGIEVRLAGINQTIADADDEGGLIPEVASDLGVALECMNVFAAKLFTTNLKFDGLMKLMEKRGRCAVLVADRFFRELLAGAQLGGAFPQSLDIVATADEIEGSPLEDCPFVIPGWFSPGFMRAHLEPPRNCDVHLLLYPNEFQLFRKRERELVRAARKAGLWHLGA